MRMAQKTSWGLMQIMGGVAYELGFKGWPGELLDPETNLYYGCEFLIGKIFLYGDEDPARLYAAYNAGSPRFENGRYRNQRNVDNFMLIYQNDELNNQT